MDLQNNLSNQFRNAEREYRSKDFLTKIKRSIGVPVPAKVKEIKAKSKGEKNNTEELNWFCIRCTYYNENNRTNQCTICLSYVRPENT